MQITRPSRVCLGSLFAVLIASPSVTDLHGQGTAALTYAFSEGTGTTTEDNSGNGLTATLMNGLAWTASGRYGSGLTFDGGDDFVEVPSGTPLDLATAFTLEAWIYPTSTPPYGEIFGRPLTGGGVAYSLTVCCGSTIMARGTTGNGQVSAYGIATISPNQWTHVAATWDGTTLRTYVNGTTDGEASLTGTLLASAEPLRIGGGPGTNFSGLIDEVRIYHRALSAGELAFDMSEAVDTTAPPTVSLRRPAASVRGVVPTTAVTATFTKAMLGGTVSSSTMMLEREDTHAVVSAMVTYDGGSRTATLTPSAALENLTTYRVTVVGGVSGVLDAGSGQMTGDVTWTFRTAPTIALPQLAYSFGEGAGTQAVDGSGNEQPALLLNGTTWTDGRYDNAVTLDGGDDRVEVTNSPPIDLTTAFTLEAWVYPTSTTPYGAVIARSLGEGGEAFGLTVCCGSTLMGRGTTGAGSASAYGLATIPSNQWTHVAATWDGATLRTYVNGLADSEAALSGTLRPSAEPLRIGGGPGTNFTGRVDEVRLYRRALEPSEIAADMNTPIDDLTPPTVVSVSPSAASVGISPGANLIATFSESLVASSVGSLTFVLKDDTGTLVPAFVTYDVLTNTATLNPSARLANLTMYTVTLRGAPSSPAIEDLHGNRLAADYVWSFTTADAETTSPTITARVAPAANEFGWHNQQVTVSFECADVSGIASCPDPVILTNEGAGQVVTRTAVDLMGNEASTTVTVNIDRTFPAVTIQNPPTESTTADTEILFSSHAADALSGLSTAKCNGQPAELPLSGDVECVVALLPGGNALVVRVTDKAGNQSSRGVYVTRETAISSISINPHQQTLALGESRLLVATSNYGRTVANMSWSSSDASIAAVDDDGVVTAIAAGQATISGSTGGLVATATVDVLATAVIPLGTVRWAAEPTPGFSSQTLIYANRVSDEGADMFLIEQEPTNGVYLVRAFRADGTQISSESTSATPLFGDSYGGLIGATPLEIGTLESKNLIRFGGGGNVQPWTYEPADQSRVIPSAIAQGRFRQNVAQSDEGTVYLVEHGTNIDGSFREPEVVALGGSTGQVLFRIPLPVGTIFNDFCGLSQDSGPTEGYAGPLSVDDDGSVVLTVLTTISHNNYACDSEGNIDLEQSTFRDDLSLHFVRVSSGGSRTMQLLQSHTGVTYTLANPDNEFAFPGPALPDGTGGVLATWWRTHYSNHVYDPYENRVTRVWNGTLSEHVLSISSPPPSAGVEFYVSPLALVGDNGIAYLTDGSTLKAIDVTTWATKWTKATAATPAIALDAGAVMVHSPSTAALATVAADGTDINTIQVAISALASLVKGQGRFHGLSPTLQLIEVVGPQVCESAHSFSMLGGNDSEQRTRRRCRTPPPNPAHKGLIPDREYTYRFATNPQAPWTADEKFAVEEAMLKWTGANIVSGLNTTFAPASEGAPSQDLLIRKQALDEAANFTRGPVAADGTITGGIITFTTDQLRLKDPRGYVKAALHEIGHAIGLQHQTGFNGSSVMNHFGEISQGVIIQRRDDYRGNLPMDVTPCDREAAKEYSTRPWP